MYYNIKATLCPTKRLVRFEEIFNETKRAFLELVRHRIPSSAQGQFSYGTVYGGGMTKNEEGVNVLSFSNGGFWNFSTVNKDLMFNVYEGIARNEEFAFGMYIDGVDDIIARYVDGLNFITCRPGLIVRDIRSDGEPYMFTMLADGQRFIEALEDNTIRKVRDIAPHLDPSMTIRPVNGEVYKRKSAWIDNIYHPFNEGVFSIDTSREVMELLACTGLGDLTHMGFGHIMRMEDPLTRRNGYMKPDLKGHETRWVDGQFVNGQTVQHEYR